MRRNLLLATVAAAALVAGCGDGVDERYAAEGGAPTATEATTTEPKFDELAAEGVNVRLRNTAATYSGAHSAIVLADGSYLVSGFDNESDPRQPERGAIWHSDDLVTWERVGLEISDGDNQQTVAGMTLVDERVVAVGTDFSRESTRAQLTGGDAVAWLSDDDGNSFERIVIEPDARAYQVGQFGDRLAAWGELAAADGTTTGRMWWSDDDGETWAGSTPVAVQTPGEAPTPLISTGPMVEWNGGLVLFGVTSATDPFGAGFVLNTSDLLGALPAWTPIDVAVWWSTDGGASWRAAAPQGLAGMERAQQPIAAAVVGDRVVLLGSSARTDDDGTQRTTVWVCDAALSRCDAIEPMGAEYDFAGGALATDGTYVYGIASGYDLEPVGQNDVLFMLDPQSLHVRVSGVADEIQQVETLLIDGDRLVLFGNGTETNRMQVATADLP